MASGWTPLESIPAQKLLKKYGGAAASFVRSASTGALLPPTWLLDKKGFRRAVESELPADHEVCDVIQGEAGLRAQRAARAYERLVHAESSVPELPLEFPSGRICVWSSVVTKPLDPTPFGTALFDVEMTDVRDAVSSLWAWIYLDSNLRRLPRGVTRVEVAIGLTLYADEPPAFLLTHSQPAEESEVFAPAPGFVRLALPLVELERSILRATADAWRKEISSLVKSVPAKLIVVGARELGLPEGVRAKLAARTRSPLSAAAAEMCLGPLGGPVEPFGTPGAVRSAVELLGQLGDAPALERRVQDLGARVREHFAWMREMDLAILPEDGLRRSLEELARFFAEEATLIAKTSVAAALHQSAYAWLTSVPVEEVDAGLEVPLVHFLVDFEEAMARVRADVRAREALTRVLPPPPGPGFRALEAFRRERAELFGFTDASVLPHDLVEAARLALSGPVDISSLVAHTRARADREVASFEARHSRMFGALVSPLRAQARSLVVLREEARYLEAITSLLFARVAEDVDRRLVRMEPGLNRGASYHAGMDELVRIVDLRGAGLRARVEWRRAELEAVTGSMEGASPLWGVARLRRLPLVLRLPYLEEPLSYSGRASDTVPLVARALGAHVEIE